MSITLSYYVWKMLVKHITRIVNALYVVFYSALWPPLTMPYQWGNAHFHVIAKAPILSPHCNRFTLDTSPLLPCLPVGVIEDYRVSLRVRRSSFVLHVNERYIYNPSFICLITVNPWEVIVKPCLVIAMIPDK